MRDVCSPGKDGRDVNHKELKALYPLYLLSMHLEAERSVHLDFWKSTISSLVFKAFKSRSLSEHYSVRCCISSLYADSLFVISPIIVVS